MPFLQDEKHLQTTSFGGFWNSALQMDGGEDCMAMALYLGESATPPKD